MVSLITDLKLSVCSAAISALATFAERDASASGASLTIVLALWRSLTNALLAIPAGNVVGIQPPGIPLRARPRA